MISPATVSIARPAREDFARSQRAVWASLPMSLTEDPDKAQLVAVDGQLPGWLDTLAAVIRPGIAGALVVRPVAGPSAHDIRAVANAAADAGTTVVVQTAWASNPAVPQLARTAAEKIPGIALIDSLIQMPGDSPGQWADVLLDHLTLLRAMAGPLDAVHFATRGINGYTVNGGQQSAVVMMSAVRSALRQPAVRLAAYGAAAEVHLVVPAGDTAAPAAAWIVDQADATVQPTRYESASRASWRRLHDAAAGRSGEPSTDLSDLADDTEFVVAITSNRQSDQAGRGA
jgi:hypothetical protein